MYRMRWEFAAAIIAGSVAGAANYLLLARFCRQVLEGGRRAGLWLLGAVLPTIAGLALCTAFARDLLVWYGCAAGGCLPLLALGRMAWIMKEKR